MDKETVAKALNSAASARRLITPDFRAMQHKMASDSENPASHIMAIMSDMPEHQDCVVLVFKRPLNAEERDLSRAGRFTTKTGEVVGHRVFQNVVKLSQCS